MPDDDPLITTGEVAKRVGVTPGAVGKWARNGILTPAVITPGGRYRWRWSEVQQQMHERQLLERELREKRQRGE